MLYRFLGRALPLALEIAVFDPKKLLDAVMGASATQVGSGGADHSPGRVAIDSSSGVHPGQSAESTALTDHKEAIRISGLLHEALRPYEDFIREAAMRFRVPPVIIGAVIMAESGGNSRAKTRTSSARGLMQTIAGTFQEAREDLISKGIAIDDDPFDPRASIMAGSWYLDRMYAQAAMDREENALNRRDIATWRYPLEYYYAGPGNGRKEKERVIIYAGGKRVVIDKPAYSRKVLQWAEIMSKSGWRSVVRGK